MNILVTDGENRSSLAVTRSLGRRGCNVFVTGRELGNISASSRFCRKAYTASDPMCDSGNYAQSIAEIVSRENIDVIFPMTEQSVYCLNKASEQLGKNVILACATPEKMEAVSNKFMLFQLAEKLGVGIPETIYVTGADDFFKKRSLISSFPVVVKPAYSKIVDGNKIISTGVMYAVSPNELNRLYETKPELRYPSMIQELIVGEGTGLFSLFDHDHHLALFSHRRLMEKPPSGGVSVLSESISLDDEMVDAASKLLSEVGWEGIAMVEFKRDVRDGRAKLMEINGRFWGSLQLAVSSGMDFPALCLDYYLNKKPASLLSDYRVGHKLKWFFGILDHLIISVKNKDRLKKLSPEYLTPWQVTKVLLKSGDANTSFDVYDAQDLKPFVSEITTYIRNLRGPLKKKSLYPRLKIAFNTSLGKSDELKRQTLELLQHNKGFAHPEKWIDYGIEHNFKKVHADKLEECPDCSAGLLNFIGQFIYYSTLVKLKSCAQCGLIFSDTRIDPIVLQAHFECAYKDEDYFLHQRHRIFNQISNLVTQLAPPIGKILDIGGAKGHQLGLIKQLRPDLNLVHNDISKVACDYASTQYGLETICGDVKKLEQTSVRFDVVIMSDVVYYEPELQKLWKLLPNIVSSNSVVILRVPNKLALINFWQFIIRIIGRHANLKMQDRIKFFNPEHLYVFSRQYLITRLKKIGFSQISIIPSELLKPDRNHFRHLVYYHFAKIVSTLSWGKLAITPSIFVIAKGYVPIETLTNIESYKSKKVDEFMSIKEPPLLSQPQRENVPRLCADLLE